MTSETKHPEIHTFDEDTNAGDPLTDCVGGGGGCTYFKNGSLTGECGNAASENYGKSLLIGFADGHCPDHSELK